MDHKLPQDLHGFVLRYAQELPEIKATLYRMEYEKNGADLVWLDRADDNKTFCIGFKTIPQDDTGVFHILEHSVLNGSEKYPVKEPFVELLKSSLQTFLNAMTYPDKTVYPVSSRNDQDFLNLMDVYLDATLHPLCAKDPHAYRQEGWHYELDSPEGELTCNGVVFNEMKGAYADPSSLLGTGLLQMLFPDNCYGYESGGHPDHITELTYENYQASYRRFYHPSNSRIVLDGAVDMDAALAKLDSYLSAFDRIDPDTDIPMQAPVAPAERTDYYEIGPDEDGTDKVLMAQCWVFGTYEDKEKNTALSVLAQALTGSNEAPLKKALLEAGLCQDVSLYVNDGVQQTMAELSIRNTSLEKKDQVWETIERTLRELADNGLDHSRLHAILNRQEFTTREKDFGGMPRGLVYALSTMDTWLYGGDPAESLCFDETFRSLREKIDQGWFEDLLREVFLEGKHTARMCLVPSATVGEEKRQAERERLAQVKAGWDEARIAQVMDEFKALRARQERQDTPEELATLPVLSLGDIPEEAPALRQTVGQIGGNTLLHQDADTDGITYLDLYFDVSDLPMEELAKLPMLGRLLGQLATEHYDALALRSRIEGSLGRFSASAASYAKAGCTKCCRPVVVVSAAMLEDRKADARELIKEVLQTTRFDGAQVYNILRQSRIMSEQMIINRGNAAASMRALASWSAKGAVDETLTGIAQLRWLQAAEKDFEPTGGVLCGELAALCRKIFTRERVTASLTGGMDAAWLESVLADLPSGPMGEKADYAPRAKAAEGFAIPAEIGFSARCGSLATLGKAVTGAGRVASNLLTYDYLWNEVRVKGGAYGTNLRIGEDGSVSFSSFRDPGCGRSLDTFTGAGAALRSFCDSGEQPDKYIISTIGDMDPLLTPRMEGTMAAAMYFSGRTQADRQQARSEVLHTTVEELRTFSRELDALCGASTVCVVGGDAALDACGDKITSRERLQQ